MKLNLSFSTCPNDTFAFDALVHNKIDTEGLNFNVHLADVEELNKLAIENRADITKLSFAAYPQVSENYKILKSGSALGTKNGPLFVSKTKIFPDETENIRVAIPGKHTTAAALLNISFPKIKNIREYLFSDVEEAILSNEVDAGVLIHEGRFVYAQKGLKLIADLGEMWEQRTQAPIPLGCIAVRRNIDVETQIKFDKILQKSIEFAIKNPTESFSFVKKNAQEMDNVVIQKHIALFVNKFTVQLGENGKNAIETFFCEMKKNNPEIEIYKPLFVD